MKLVNKLTVENEGAILLAFIDTVNEQGFSWNIQSHNGQVKLTIYSPKLGEISSGPQPNFTKAKNVLIEKHEPPSNTLKDVPQPRSRA